MNCNLWMVGYIAFSVTQPCLMFVLGQEDHFLPKASTAWCTSTCPPMNLANGYDSAPWRSRSLLRSYCFIGWTLGTCFLEGTGILLGMKPIVLTWAKRPLVFLLYFTQRIWIYLQIDWSPRWNTRQCIDAACKRFGHPFFFEVVFSWN